VHRGWGGGGAAWSLLQSVTLIIYRTPPSLPSEELRNKPDVIFFLKKKVKQKKLQSDVATVAPPGPSDSTPRAARCVGRHLQTAFSRSFSFFLFGFVFPIRAAGVSTAMCC